MNWYNIIIIRHIEKFNYDPLKVDSSRAMVVGQNTIYIYVCGVYLYLHTVHTANTTCCGHIVINIIYITYIYTYIRYYVIGRRRGALAQRVNVSAPRGRGALRRDASGMSGVFVLCFPSPNDATVLLFCISSI